MPERTRVRPDAPNDSSEASPVQRAVDLAHGPDQQVEVLVELGPDGAVQALSDAAEWVSARLIKATRQRRGI